eukprot:3940643-Rhodomonas_salina.10
MSVPDPAFQYRAPHTTFKYRSRRSTIVYQIANQYLCCDGRPAAGWYVDVVGTVCALFVLVPTARRELRTLRHVSTGVPYAVPALDIA